MLATYAANICLRLTNSKVLLVEEPFISDYYYGVADIIATEVDGMIDAKANPVKKGANGKLASTVELSLNKCTQLSNPASCYYHYTEA